MDLSTIGGDLSCHALIDCIVDRWTENKAHMAVSANN
jgi:hypothetical protein